MMTEEEIWLVKSGGRILGPYHLSQVEDLVRKRELHVVDEVAEPNGRWHLLRDHHAFQDFLFKLRQEDSTLDDGTSTTDSFTASLTENVMNAVMAADDITEDISEQQNQFKEIIYEDLKETPRPQNKQSVAPPSRFQSPSQMDESRLRREAEKGAKGLWVVTIIAFLLVAGIIVSKRWPQAAQKIISDDTSGVGLQLYQEGEYVAALDILKKSFKVDPTQKKVWFPLATLLSQIDGQTVEAKRLLQKALDENLVESGVAWTAMAINQMVDNDVVGAEESLKKALIDQPQLREAQINQGVLALLKKDYASAQQILNTIYENGERGAEAVFSLLTAQVMLARSSGNKEFLISSAKILDRYLKDFADFQQEFRLFEIYIKYLRNEFPQTQHEAAYKAILDVDPSLSDEFKRPILIGKHMAVWTQIGVWCREIASLDSTSARAQGLLAVCLHKQGQFIQAKDGIEKAIQQSPKDPLLQSIYAGILKNAGYASESSVAIGRAVELDRRGEYVLPSLLQARFCTEKQDLDCANTYWMKVLQLDSKSPAAKVGMAQVYWLKKSKNEAEKLVQEVSEIYPHYKPNQRLKKAMSSTVIK